MRVLIIGCGYVGVPLAELLAGQGHEVCALRRSAPSLPAHVQWLQADITDPNSLSQVAPPFDAVVNTVASSRGGLEDYRAVYLQGTRNLLGWLAARPPVKYLYTSSTSVYAQNDGSWVTELSEAAPDSTTSQVLVETEQALLQAHQNSGFPALILRVAGIYGPQRGHLFKQYLKGEASLREDGSAYINNIHRSDVAGALAHLLEYGEPGQVYNTVDDEPVTQRTFFQWLAERLNRPLPPSAPPDPHRKRGLTNKRVSNAKLRNTGYQFRYPTFREGYAAEMQRLRISAAQ